MQRSCAGALRLFSLACVKRFREAACFAPRPSCAVTLTSLTTPISSHKKRFLTARQRQPQPLPALPGTDAMDSTGFVDALDKEQFKQQLLLKAIQIPTKECQQYMTLLSRCADRRTLPWCSEVQPVCPLGLAHCANHSRVACSICPV